MGFKTLHSTKDIARPEAIAGRNTAFVIAGTLSDVLLTSTAFAPGGFGLHGLFCD
jgi:hypothetical protein